MSVDLNALRTVVINNQLNRQALPSDPSRQVVVDRNGKVLIGIDVTPGTQTTQVPQETFAAKA
jgi:hypothetical protein